jgi:hypothetical protein
MLHNAAYLTLPMVPVTPIPQYATVSTHAHKIISKTPPTSGPLIQQHFGMHSLIVQIQHNILTVTYEGIHAGTSACQSVSTTAHLPLHTLRAPQPWQMKP